MQCHAGPHFGCSYPPSVPAEELYAAEQAVSDQLQQCCDHACTGSPAQPTASPPARAPSTAPGLPPLCQLDPAASAYCSCPHHHRCGLPWQSQPQPLVWASKMPLTQQLQQCEELAVDYFEHCCEQCGLGGIDPSQLHALYSQLPTDPDAANSPLERLKAACMAAACSPMVGLRHHTDVVNNIIATASTAHSPLTPAHVDRLIASDCFWCGQPLLSAANCLSCQECQLVSYCSSDCQRQDANSHATVCSLCRSYQPNVVHSSFDSALILRVIHSKHHHEAAPLASTTHAAVAQLNSRGLLQTVRQSVDKTSTGLFCQFAPHAAVQTELDKHRRCPVWSTLANQLLLATAQFVRIHNRDRNLHVSDLQVLHYLQQQQSVQDSSCQTPVHHQSQLLREMWLSEVIRLLRTPYPYVLSRPAVAMVLGTDESSYPPLHIRCLSVCAAGCGQPGTQQCGRCRSVSYCGKVCQTHHWQQQHKGQCAALKAWRAGLLPPGCDTSQGQQITAGSGQSASTLEAVQSPSMQGAAQAGHSAASPASAGFAESEGQRVVAVVCESSSATAGGSADCDPATAGGCAGQCGGVTDTANTTGAQAEDSSTPVTQDGASPPLYITSGGVREPEFAPAEPLDPEAVARACREMLSENPTVQRIAEVVLDGAPVEATEDKHMLGLQQLLILACMLDEEDMAKVKV